jgi:NADH dehydrogenase FAD-containing subunit
VRIVLIDMGPRVPGSFAEGLSRAAQARLERLGVEVRLGKGADRIDDDGVVVGCERLASKTVIWTAGVAPSPAAKWLNAPADRRLFMRVSTIGLVLAVCLAGPALAQAPTAQPAE